MNVIDAGTTTLKLYNEKDGRTYSQINSQYIYGSDVITRVENAIMKDKSEELSTLLKSSIDSLKNKSGCDKEIIIIGNTIMHHLYYALSLDGFRKMPFSLSDEKTDSDLDAFLSPLSPFIGSDTYPMALKLMEMKEKNVLAIDFGTNCEVLLKKGNRIFASSAPAGPAFDMLCFKDSRTIVDLIFKGSFIPVYDKSEGKGDCIKPSVLIKLLSILLETGNIEKNGRLKDEVKIGEFVLNQNRIREFQKAKAAVSSLWKILIKYYAESFTPEKVLVCGNLINGLKTDNLKKLGLIPETDDVILFKERLSYFSHKVEEEKIELLMEKIMKKLLVIPHFNMPDFESCYLSSLNFR